MATTFAGAFAERREHVDPFVRQALDPSGETERLRASLAALEAECAALADVLGKLTHEYTAWRRGEGAYCECGLSADAAMHSTPHALRERYGFGAA